MARRLHAALLIALMAIGGFSLWTVIPLGWIWIGSQLSETQQPQLGAYVLVLGGIVVSVVAVAKALGALNRRLIAVAGMEEESGRVPLPWMRSMRDEERRPGATVLDIVLVASAVTAVVAMVLWFFLLAGSPLAARSGDGLAADIAQLRGKQCPAYRAPYEREYSREEVAAAREGRFTIYRGMGARLVPPVDWTRNPSGRRGFRASLQTLKFLDVLLYAYRVDGSRVALRQAKALALDWVRANPGPGQSESGLAWFNKTVGERAPYLSYLVRALACERLMTRRQGRAFTGAVRLHGLWLANPANYYPSNHGLFMDVGLLLLAGHYFPFLDGADAWESAARERFPSTLAGRVSREGAWLEHSVGYHFLVMDLARRFGELGGGNGRVRHLLGRLTRAAAWFVAPDGRLAQLGDTDLDLAPQAVRRRAKRLDGMEVMHQAGLAFVHHRDGYLAIAAGFHNQSHKQSDELTFELAEGPVRIVAGPGKYGFDRDARRRYVVSARSHSVLTVNGRSFPRDPRLAYGSGIVDARRAKGWYVIVARNPLLRSSGVEHRRAFLYKPGEALVIEDRVQSARPRRYTRYLQLGPGVGVEKRDAAHLALRAGEFHGCVEDSLYGEGRLARRRTVRGQRHPFQGWTFPQAIEAVPRWSVAYTSRAASTEHVLAISLDGGCAAAGADLAEQVREAEGLLAQVLDDTFGPEEPPESPPPEGG